MRANIAIVGSTGNAGRKTIEVLERRKFPVNILYLLASKKSVGKFIKFRNKNIEVRSLEDFDFRKRVVSNAFKLHKLRGLEENIRRSNLKAASSNTANASNTAAASKQVSALNFILFIN